MSAFRNTKIKNNGISVWSNTNIFGLQVPMVEPSVMGGLQCADQLFEEIATDFVIENLGLGFKIYDILSKSMFL